MSIYGHDLAPGSLHVLHNSYDNTDAVYKWTGWEWAQPEKDWGKSPYFMVAHWRSYVRPARKGCQCCCDVRVCA